MKRNRIKVKSSVLIAEIKIKTINSKDDMYNCTKNVIFVTSKTHNYGKHENNNHN